MLYPLSYEGGTGSRIPVLACPAVRCVCALARWRGVGRCRCSRGPMVRQSCREDHDQGGCPRRWAQPLGGRLLMPFTLPTNLPSLV